jgi:glycosyltransferase involved in cell wall biosynthesis
MLVSLKVSLYGQIAYYHMQDQVEVLTLVDNKEQTTGAKRNALLEMAKGEYIDFIDDDDEIKDNYLPLVMMGVNSGSDVVGMRLIHYQEGKIYGYTTHSIRFKEWKNIPGENGIWTFQRCPNHLNPVRRELALKAGFPDLTIGEDRDYSYRLRPLLKTEYMIEEPIYFYMERKK